MGTSYIWEKNGNFQPSDQCGFHTMDEPSLPLSTNIQLPRADWNSNQIINTEEKDLISETTTNHNNKCSSRDNTPSTLNSPTVFNSEGLSQKDLSYDDLSKNIDANLAEIDMETFRSEDINSILALPAIYSGNFESVSHGEQCASVSGSLLNGLEIDTSVSNRISEDEISICKDEPLFSPQREPQPPERGAISVDSLDNSSSYDQDLVLTCKANKNNYTIVFEGSETQFSEDSEYHSGCRSSEGESSTSEAINAKYETSHAASSMIQSDLVFTTWSNLKRAHFWKKRKCHHEISIKSQSLPNLNYPSTLLSEKQLWQWSKLRGINAAPLYDLEHFHSSGLQVVRNLGYPYSLSLVKLFMKYKVSSRSSVCSSEHSNSTSSLNIHSLRNFSHSITGKVDTKTRGCPEIELVCNQNYSIKNQIASENGNSTTKKPLHVDNIRILDWNSACNTTETNNNTINSPHNNGKVANNNNNDIKEGTTTSPTEECDNSQYFEDSLIEPPVLQIKNFHAMPIKEEEETDISSGDEIMRDSRSNSSSSNIETVVCSSGMVKNNALGFISNVSKQDGEHNLERINNIFPSCKSNALASGVTGANVEPTGTGITNDLASLENQTQGTQTKHFNSKNLEEFQFSAVESPKIKSRQTSSEQGVRHYSSSSREASPGSSGYVSSRHSSVERLHRSSAYYHGDTSPKFTATSNKGIVLLTKTRNCATQVPVHVKDFAMQTSTLGGSHPNVGFLLNDSPGENLPWAIEVKDQSVKRKLEQMSTSAFAKSNKKEDKCIYVCFPNYSLPDLSFLKSVISDDSGSVFLTPTKFKPPQEPFKTPHIRPKSCGGIDACTRKHLSSIKDWESLKVLLPDDLKQLLSDLHLKDSKLDPSTSAEGLAKSKSLHSSASSKSSNSSDKSGPCENLSESSGRKHFPRSILRKSSSQQDGKKRLSRPWSCCAFGTTACRECNRACFEMESQSACACNCSKFSFPETDVLKLYNDTQHIKPSGQPLPGKQNSHNAHVFNANCASKDYSFLSRPAHQSKDTPAPHQCLLRTADKSSPSGAAVDRVSSEKDFAFMDKLTLACCADGLSQKFFPRNKDTLPQPCGQVSALGHFKAMHDEEKMKCKNSTVEFDHVAAKDFESDHLSKDCQLKICPDDFFDSEKPPQEFLVSPVQNPQPYSVPPDLYLLQNSLDSSNKLFHESLKRKTGLVENLQKATSIIYDHRVKNNKQSLSCSSSFSIGQKILTSLCPAVHTILSDGLLPSVQGFFGPLPNSPWKVAEASVQLEKSKVEVQDILNQVNSEKLLTDSTYKFNAFIVGLLNLGCLEWWLGHLLSSRSLISHHYHPTALLSLLALPASTHLQQELTELVSPLTNLSFNLDLTCETKMASIDAYGKCTANCCKQNRCPIENHALCEDYPQTKANFSLNFPHNELEKNRSEESDRKYHLAMDELLASEKNCRVTDFKADDSDNQIWPGITINPFPNAKVDDPSQMLRNVEKKSPSSKAFMKSECDRSFPNDNCLKEREHSKKPTPEFSLCSSTDSGCSSQAGQSHVLSVTMDSREPEIQASAKPDGQQFRKLQQKWEKITHGVDEPFPKKPQQNPPSFEEVSPNHKVTKRPTPSMPTKKQMKCNVSVKIGGTPQKRAVSQPPAGKKFPTDQVEVFYERRLQTPDVIASSKVSCHVSEKEKKGRSQIPTLKFGKNLQAKSKIPIQRSGGRAQSANRESRL